MSKKKASNKRPAKRKRAKAKPKEEEPAEERPVVDDAPASAADEIDNDLARQALEKKRAGQTPTRRELQALKRVEKRELDKTRWRIYRSIPQVDYRKLSGRQNKTLHEQASRYGLPFNKAFINLEEFLPALHNFLAKNARLFESEDGLLAGDDTESLERLRKAQAIKVELQNEVTLGNLRPADDVHRMFAEIASIFRDANDELVREFGEGARAILEEAIDRGRQRLREIENDRRSEPTSGSDSRG